MSSGGQYTKEQVEEFVKKNSESIREQVRTEKIFDFFLQNSKVKKKYV